MSQKAKVKLELKVKTISDKVSLGQAQLNRIKNSANFPNPAPSIAEVQAVVTNLSKARAEQISAKQTLKSKTHRVSAAEKKYDGVFTRLGNYINGISQGNKTIIIDAGMKFFFPGGSPRVGRLPAPKKFKVVYTQNKGELLLKWQKVPKAIVYNIERALSNETGTKWEEIGFTTSTKFLADNLESGIKYFFRLNALGTAGKSAPTGVVNRIAP